MVIKHLFLLALAGPGLLLGGCQRLGSGSPPLAAVGCLDPSRIDSAGVCTMEYNPVCGCNGRTYANPCAATKAGLRTFTAGPCPTQARP